MAGNVKYIRQILSRLINDGEVSAKELPELLDRLDGVPKRLLTYISDRESVENVSNFAGTNLYKEGVAQPKINRWYQPAVRTAEDNIIFDNKSKYHGEVVGNHLLDLINSGKVKPDHLKPEFIKGTGAIAPDGGYYESKFFGDANDIPEYMVKIIDKYRKD